MNIKWAVFFVALSLSESSFGFCPKKFGEGVLTGTGFGVAFATAPIAFLDYAVSKSSSYERAIPSDKQAEFILGLPLAYGLVMSALDPQSHNQCNSAKAAHVYPYLSEEMVPGIAFNNRF